jgi:hypothetical protein
LQAEVVVAELLKLAHLVVVAVALAGIDHRLLANLLEEELLLKDP